MPKALRGSIQHDHQCFPITFYRKLILFSFVIPAFRSRHNSVLGERINLNHFYLYLLLPFFLSKAYLMNSAICGDIKKYIRYFWYWENAANFSLTSATLQTCKRSLQNKITSEARIFNIKNINPSKFAIDYFLFSELLLRLQTKSE